MVTIYEPPVRNSGIIGGKFLERTRVAKPCTTMEKPQFYGPQDFAIGAVIKIFKHINKAHNLFSPVLVEGNGC